MDVDMQTLHSTAPASKRSRALSLVQERKLVDYLDEEFLQLMRGYKKRLVNLRALHFHTIPPIDPSTSLRTAYLLRLTNDTLSSIVGYPPDSSSLPEALDWLDDLDQAWLTVLEAQVWDPSTRAGIDLYIDATDASKGVKTSPMSQTERTRLRSLLVGSATSLEEWLEDRKEGVEEQDVESMLERLGLQAEFDDLFSRTLNYLGGLSGIVVDGA
ncbi:hypothetical protein C0993_003102 [Termitomyces sp. T159_Od127]|nr:hypothetical protein C0993_003102 [Termitomyces sp. T159_Od127]